ncbi:hypothetical protein F383_18656 [Gossypium arboreum]|uniref:Uncharacterized protein n=1 Tax=Gossypium arboreum TaxID=29729 RepID=A0A0B0NGM9_GOSAR|nr:hypothetical protein F383_18656 [Gossypium arboreum]
MQYSKSSKFKRNK